MISMLKKLSFKKKKKRNDDRNQPKKVDPKVNNKCDVKPNEVQKQSEQKPIEKDLDAKTSKNEIPKKTTSEKSKRIELVGDYLKSDHNKKSGSLPTPAKPIRRKSSLKGKTPNESVITGLDVRDSVRKEVVDTRKRMNETLDTIKEMNGENEVNKSASKGTEDKLKTDQNIKTSDKCLNESEVNRKDICISIPKQAIDWKRFAMPSTSVSGLVPIKDIDLKSAQCVICLHLVSNQIQITVCSHIFCDNCLDVWLKYSQHCPQCRTLITNFGHSIRTEDNRICVRSEKDYKVSKVSVSADNFVESLSSAYLFEAFLLNREYYQYLDSTIASICGKISELEVMLTNNRNVQTNVNIRYRINEENHRLEDMRQKKKLSEESFQQICGAIDPEMVSFWQQVVALREYSDLN